MSTIRVEYATVDEFRLGLGSLMQEMTSLLGSMSSLESRPKLGDFDHAIWTRDRHAALKNDFIRRLQQVVVNVGLIRDGNEAATTALQQGEHGSAAAITGVTHEDLP